MSSLKSLEKEQFESLFGMNGGYALEFSNRTFARFFEESANVDIYDAKYERNGSSKANRLRTFWDTEDDQIVGKVLAELIDYWNHYHPEASQKDRALADQRRRTVERLIGQPLNAETSEEQFLRQNLQHVSLANVPMDSQMLPILDGRIQEAQRCIEVGAPLAAIFLCGSVLEGLLLGTACINPQVFNQAPNSPRGSDGKVKKFPEWTLAQLIDVACEVGFLQLDVKKFSHALRDFRNYIHPFQQLSSQFNPDCHTAEICLQVLKAGIASLSGKRVQTNFSSSNS